MKQHVQSAIGFVVFLLMCLSAQLTGSFLTVPAIRSGWYRSLIKPAFNPPDWVFGPVWTVLYFTMAVAAWLIWSQEKDNALVKPALFLFFVQLVFNVLWSAFFFSMRRPDFGLIGILLLWLMILAMVLVFFRIHRWAGLILIPYLLWVLFASVLNGAIWWLNKGTIGPGGVVT